jgi:solute carrier family 8 (sodium/calcium exchanger)
METHSLGFSVVLFCSLAMIALFVMMLRRSKVIGGELGGPRGYKIATSCLFVFLWLFYVLMSSLEAYGYINGMYYTYRLSAHTEIESLFIYRPTHYKTYFIIG